MGGSANQRRGFTLIELLVVVSIIALLISILLPSLREAREQAKRTICTTSLRNIWLGVLTYANENRDRVPFMEDVNLTDPNADPFDSSFPTTAGVVLFDFVQPGTWRCPSAVAGYPANAGHGRWTMTYTFRSAGPVGEGIPYDDAPMAHTGDLQDPAMASEVHFDGRPLRLLDGRKYVAVVGYNHNDKGFWNVLRPIFAEALAGEPAIGMPKYPHRGSVKPRNDLRAARSAFERITLGGGAKPAYHELHADKNHNEIFLTRALTVHRPGF